MAKRRKKMTPTAATPPAPLLPPATAPRTGVGTPDAHVEPAGVALGGDTGDVVIPHTSRVPAGDTGGAGGDTEWSTVWHDPDAPADVKRAA